MANFCVQVDVVMCKYIYVKADSEEEAVKKVQDAFDENPYRFAYNFNHFVKCGEMFPNEEDDNLEEKDLDLV